MLPRHVLTIPGRYLQSTRKGIEPGPKNEGPRFRIAPMSTLSQNGYGASIRYTRAPIRRVGGTNPFPAPPYFKTFGFGKQTPQFSSAIFLFWGRERCGID